VARLAHVVAVVDAGTAAFRAKVSVYGIVAIAGIRFVDVVLAEVVSFAVAFPRVCRYLAELAFGRTVVMTEIVRTLVLEDNVLDELVADYVVHAKLDERYPRNAS
jgi:hypothetical protein